MDVRRVVHFSWGSKFYTTIMRFGPPIQIYQWCLIELCSLNHNLFNTILDCIIFHEIWTPHSDFINIIVLSRCVMIVSFLGTICSCKQTINMLLIGFFFYHSIWAIDEFHYIQRNLWLFIHEIFPNHTVGNKNPKRNFRKKALKFCVKGGKFGLHSQHTVYIQLMN